MTANRFVIASIAGAAMVLLLGVITGAIFSGPVEGFAVTSPDLVMKSSPSTWAIIVSALAMGGLLSVLLGCWTGHTKPASAFRTSAVFGLLLALIIGFSLYATTNMLNLTGTLVKVVIDTAQLAVTGTVVGAVLNRGRRDQPLTS